MRYNSSVDVLRGVTEQFVTALSSFTNLGGKSDLPDDTAADERLLDALCGRFREVLPATSHRDAWNCLCTVWAHYCAVSDAVANASVGADQQRTAPLATAWRCAHSVCQSLANSARGGPFGKEVLMAHAAVKAKLALDTAKALAQKESWAELWNELHHVHEAIQGLSEHESVEDVAEAMLFECTVLRVRAGLWLQHAASVRDQLELCLDMLPEIQNPADQVARVLHLLSTVTAFVTRLIQQRPSGSLKRAWQALELCNAVIGSVPQVTSPGVVDADHEHSSKLTKLVCTLTRAQENVLYLQLAAVVLDLARASMQLKSAIQEEDEIATAQLYLELPIAHADVTRILLSRCKRPTFLTAIAHIFLADHCAVAAAPGDERAATGEYLAALIQSPDAEAWMVTAVAGHRARQGRAQDVIQATRCAIERFGSAGSAVAASLKLLEDGVMLASASELSDMLQEPSVRAIVSAHPTLAKGLVEKLLNVVEVAASAAKAPQKQETSFVKTEPHQTKAGATGVADESRMDFESPEPPQPEEGDAIHRLLDAAQACAHGIMVPRVLHVRSMLAFARGHQQEALRRALDAVGASEALIAVDPKQAPQAENCSPSTNPGSERKAQTSASASDTAALESAEKLVLGSRLLALKLQLSLGKSEDALASLEAFLGDPGFDRSLLQVIAKDSVQNGATHTATLVLLKLYDLTVVPEDAADGRPVLDTDHLRLTRPELLRALLLLHFSMARQALQSSDDDAAAQLARSGDDCTDWSGITDPAAIDEAVHLLVLAERCVKEPHRHPGPTEWTPTEITYFHGVAWNVAVQAMQADLHRCACLLYRVCATLGEAMPPEADDVHTRRRVHRALVIAAHHAAVIAEAEPEGESTATWTLCGSLLSQAQAAAQRLRSDPRFIHGPPDTEAELQSHTIAFHRAQGMRCEQDAAAAIRAVAAAAESSSDTGVQSKALDAVWTLSLTAAGAGWKDTACEGFRLGLQRWHALGSTDAKAATEAIIQLLQLASDDAERLQVLRNDVKLVALAHRRQAGGEPKVGDQRRSVSAAESKGAQKRCIPQDAAHWIVATAYNAAGTCASMHAIKTAGALLEAAGDVAEWTQCKAIPKEMCIGAMRKLKGHIEQ